jgi:hypothetical protein
VAAGTAWESGAARHRKNASVLACSAWNAPSVPHGENSESGSAVLHTDSAHSERWSRFRRAALGTSRPAFRGGRARSPCHLPQRLHARHTPGPRRLSQLWSPCWPRARLADRMLAMSLSAPSMRPRPAPGLCQPCGYHVDLVPIAPATQDRSQTQAKSGCSPSSILNLYLYT